MRNVAGILLPFFLCGGLGAFQAHVNTPFMRRGVVTHYSPSPESSPRGNATITANDPNPLWQAIFAVREEYGWAVNFEDAPINSAAELVDNTDPNWRATHPTAKGYFIARGGHFSSTFEEPQDTVQARLGIEPVLHKIIADYNKSSNPGKYKLVAEAGNRYCVVGEYIKDDENMDRKVEPILDTPVAIPSARRSSLDTIRLVLEELHKSRSIRVNLMSFPANTMHAEAEIGGNSAPARTLLLQALASTGRVLMWDLKFEPNNGQYYLNIYVAVKAIADQNGTRRLFPVDRGQLTGKWEAPARKR